MIERKATWYTKLDSDSRTTIWEVLIVFFVIILANGWAEPIVDSVKTVLTYPILAGADLHD